jgi:proliferating cell nuclear antigen
MGINVHHVYKMLRSVKKKDSMIMFINESNPSDLGIQIIPKDQTRLTTSFIRIQNIQNLEIEVPTAYDNSVLVSSCEFAKMCKDMLQMSQTIHIRSTKFNVRFTCNLGSVYSREVMLGETGFMNNNVNINNDETLFEEDFDTEQLSRIIKVASLSSSMNIYCTPEYPMFIHTKIGLIGTISLFLKSKSQIEAETMHDRLLPPPSPSPASSTESSGLENTKEG